jgi:hypothetical protein
VVRSTERELLPTGSSVCVVRIALRSQRERCPGI